MSMGALSGSMARASRAALAAGCDVVLHCNGKLGEMQEVAAAAPMLAGRGRAARRGGVAAARHAARTIDVAALRAELARC